MLNNVFIAEGSRIVGNVILGENSSVFYNAVIRADRKKITIGKFSNVQDNCIIHAEHNDVVIGDYVSIGHGAIVHGAKIGNFCIVGMGAIVMEGAEIGENCIIGAGTLITENKKIPKNSVVVGSPGKILRESTEEDLKYIKENALTYFELAKLQSKLKNLANKNNKLYPRVTVDAIIMNEKDEILLIQRKNNPFQGMFALPGGFVEYNEKTEDACVREIKEETNLDVEIKDLVGVYSDPNRDPRGHVITLVYFVEGKNLENLRGKDDANIAKFFKISEILKMDLAFDHKKIIMDFLKKYKKF